MARCVFAKDANAARACDIPTYALDELLGGRSFLALAPGASAWYEDSMSLLTIEVSIDHGRVTPTEPAKLPDVGRGLLTILPETKAPRDPFEPHPLLRKGRILADPAEPLATDDWPESLR